MSVGPIDIPFTAKEREVLAGLAVEQGLSEGNLIRAALRLYQSAHVRFMRGEHMAWTDAEGRLIPEEVGGCMGDE